MKRLFYLSLLLVSLAAVALAQYPNVTVRELQYCPAESLAAADLVPNFTANSTVPQWTLQVSSHMKTYTTPSPSGAAYGDTVTVTGLCVVPPKILNWNVAGWTMLLYDTAAANADWGALLVMANTQSDTVQLLADGFLSVEAGDIITMTGVVAEFPNSRGFSVTEFIPTPGKPISIIGQGPLPTHLRKNVGDFYTGVFSTGKVQIASGEPYEGFLVEFTNLTLNNKVNTSRGTFSAVDASGNEISIYDASKYFTLANTTTRFPDTAWTRIYANINNGTRIDTLRGFITTVSGSEGPRGYRIAPVYPSDIVFSTLPTPPLITTHRRNPVVLTSADSATVSVRVTQQSGGSLPKTVSLLYSSNYGGFTTLPMAYQAADTSYAAVIPTKAANVIIRYFIQVADSFGQVIRLANSSVSGGIASDTSKGFFFYTVLDRPLTIRDVQYTPYVNGRSPYLGAVLSLSGIMTGDTAHISLAPATTGSTNAWYMQSGNQPWSGIWLTTSDVAVQGLLGAIKNGDSITVTGTVQEQFDVTRLGNITAVASRSTGNPEPEPVVRPTSAFNVLPGVASAEMYEGMLVRFNNVTVTSLNPTYSDETEYSINDGSGPVVVQRSGRNSYSNIAADSANGKTILKLGTRMSSITGFVYYSFNQYKFVPRTDADFQGVVLGIDVRREDALPTSFALEQNYPNPFNPSTNIRYDIPSGGSVSLRVYDLLGREVATLVNETQAPGRYTVRFDGSSLSSGIYFTRLQAGTFVTMRKMMLVK
jgi:hypothetical protein